MAKVIENSIITAAMNKARHPPYSPDLTPSDFHLFDHLQQMMTNQSFSNAHQLLSAIAAILNDMEKSHSVQFFGSG
jgi:histone-lysine N-methyltransferase SETMAR